MLFHIDPLRLWVHKVLPVVYDDSLSYYEVLAKVTKKLNEVIDLTDEQNQFIQNFSDNLTNAINNWEEGMERSWVEYQGTLNTEWADFQKNTEQYIENWKNMAESDIEDAIAAGINKFVSYFSGLTQTAVDAAEEAMRAAETAAEDAVDAVIPTLQNQFDERYAWKTAVGSPLVATTAAGMTDTTKVYVYVGDETGYVNGDWYYYDGTAWQDGGVYNSAAVVTDPTLSESGVPADAKATGDEIADLKSALSSDINTLTTDLYDTTTNLYDHTFGAGLWKQGAPNAAQIYTVYYDKKITVTEGQVIYGATKPAVASIRSVIFEYSSSDTFIQRVVLAWGNATGSYTVPDGVSYIYIGFTTNSTATPITPSQIVALGNIAYFGSESYTVSNFPERYIPTADTLSDSIYYNDLTGIHMTIGCPYTVSSDDIVTYYDDSVINYRIGTPEVHQYTYAIKFTVASGYRMLFWVKASGESAYTGTAWLTTDYTMPANAKWAMEVARSPENINLPADLATFSKAVTTSQPLNTVKSKLDGLDSSNTVDFGVNNKYLDRTDDLAQLTRFPMFQIFTDIHGFGKYLKRIGDFHDANVPSYCKDVLCLGDIVYDDFDDDFTFMSGSDFGKKVLLTIGNHDCFDGTTVGGVSATDLYNKFFTDVGLWGVTQPANAAANGLCYYYKDYGNRVRLIVLNEYYWDSAQKTWFDDVLASAKTANLAVIVAQHQGNYTELEYNHLEDYAFGAPQQTFIRVTTGYEERRNSVNTFIAGGGDFIGWINGHTHCEQFGTFTVDGTTQFSMTFANAGQDSSSRVKIPNYSMDCFYYLAVDTTDKIVYVLTIGQAVNKWYKRNLLLAYDYANQAVVEYY